MTDQETKKGMQDDIHNPDRLNVKSEYLSVKDKNALRELTVVGIELYTFIVWTRISSGLGKAARKKEGIAIMQNFGKYAEQVIETCKQEIGRIHATVLSLKFQVSKMADDHILRDFYMYILERFCVVCPGMVSVSPKTQKLDDIVDQIADDSAKNKKKSKADSDMKCDNMEALNVATKECAVGMCAPYVWAIPTRGQMEKFNVDTFVTVYRLACKYSVLAFFMLDTINRLREVKDGQISKDLAGIYRRFCLIFVPIVRENLIRMTPEARGLYIETSYHINLMHSWDDNRDTSALIRELDTQMETSQLRRPLQSELIRRHSTIFDDIKNKKIAKLAQKDKDVPENTDDTVEPAVCENDE